MIRKIKRLAVILSLFLLLFLISLHISKNRAGKSNILTAKIEIKFKETKRKKNANFDKHTTEKTLLYSERKKITNLVDKHTTKKTAESRHRLVNYQEIEKDGISNGLVVDSWSDVCLQNGIGESLWHPLFPRVPQARTVLLSTESGPSSILHQAVLKRVYGYLTIDHNGTYNIKLRSSGSAEMLLYSTNISSKADAINGTNFQSFEEVLYGKLFFHQSKTSEYSVQLNANIYFLEMLVIGPFQLFFKRNTDNQQYAFQLLEGGQTFYTKQIIKDNSDVDVLPSFFTVKHQYKLRFPVRKENRERKYIFFDIKPSLPPHPHYPRPSKLIGDDKKTPTVQRHKTCAVHSLPPPKIKKLYEGMSMIDNIVVYPKEYFEYTDHIPAQRLLLEREEAIPIIQQTLKGINDINNSTLKLDHIIHVHTNLNGKFQSHSDWRKSYYYVELQVKEKATGQIYQTSHFVQKTPKGMCFMEDMKANPEAEIVLLTAVKNQYTWVKFLLMTLADLSKKTLETKVTLMLLDSNSTDGDYKHLLQSYPTVKSRYVLIPRKVFSKVVTLNVGLSQVQDENSIAMVLDLHLELPLDFFDRTRKLTIQGKSAFSPTLLRFTNPCEHEQYTDVKTAKWEDYGPGIMAMYKSDWTRVGGFNEELYRDKWGGEDWELVDRIMTRGLHIIHYRLPRFYHFYHTRKGMWNTHE